MYVEKDFRRLQWPTVSLSAHLVISPDGTHFGLSKYKSHWHYPYWNRRNLTVMTFRSEFSNSLLLVFQVSEISTISITEVGRRHLMGSATECSGARNLRRNSIKALDQHFVLSWELSARRANLIIRDVYSARRCINRIVECSLWRGVDRTTPLNRIHRYS
ncbi:hypothetical protein BKA93DRAFT_148782 [Sparassis latifolia]